jgi:alpha-L-fucosidase 2
MNYWPAQPLNLPETEMPLIETFAEIAQSGAITAANQYAVYNDRNDDTYQPGDPWVIHHNYDLWRGTMPIDNATAGLWPTGGVWLLDHAWQMYRYAPNREFLTRIFPYIKGAVAFFTQFLVQDPVTGYLITAASCSPEQGGVQPGPAMDTQLIRNLYDTYRKATAILSADQSDLALLTKIDEQMPKTHLADEKGRLAPNLIDERGLIKEWARGDVTFDLGRKQVDPEWLLTNPFNGEQRGLYPHEANNYGGHRHASHLWEMFPGKHLSAYSDDPHGQAVYKAFQATVAAKGAGSGQGWGVAWRINLNARALNGEYASRLINQLIATRTSPNLFDQHPNFQIDGNYGICSGIIEMLMQSHDGVINLLPALPKAWHAGAFNGFKAIGGAIVSCEWKDGEPIVIKITPLTDGEVKIRVNGEIKAIMGKVGVETVINYV